MMIRGISAFIILLMCGSSLEAQDLQTSAHRGVVQVPIGEDVYAFLRHLSVRGIIKGYSEAELPIS
ncbi:MAG: hypothetical protein ABI778_03430, partial [Ignavibacteriota bacterium]